MVRFLPRQLIHHTGAYKLQTTWGGGGGVGGGEQRVQYFEMWERKFLFGIISDTLICDRIYIARVCLHFSRQDTKTLKLKTKGRRKRSTHFLIISRNCYAITS